MGVNPSFANSLSSFPLDIIPRNWSLGGSFLDLLFVECHLQGEADGRNWEALKSGWEVLPGRIGSRFRESSRPLLTLAGPHLPLQFGAWMQNC